MISWDLSSLGYYSTCQLYPIRKKVTRQSCPPGHHLLCVCFVLLLQCHGCLLGAAPQGVARWAKGQLVLHTAVPSPPGEAL